MTTKGCSCQKDPCVCPRIAVDDIPKEYGVRKCLGCGSFHGSVMAHIHCLEKKITTKT